MTFSAAVSPDLAAPSPPAGTVTVCPKDTSAALQNPGMGWVLHFYDNDLDCYGSRLALSDALEDFPGLSTIYLRLPWAYLEPEEGVFHWPLLDTPLQRWRETGRQVALRFTCCETGLRYATPEWVRQAGAKGHDFTPHWADLEESLWEPDYEDPIFLQKLSRFLEAAGARYDGSPDVAFLDVGSFGVWGEGHTSSSTCLPYSARTVAEHIDLHCRAFPNTLLVANDDFAAHGRGPDGITYAFERGLALRDDSILVEPGERAYHNAPMAQMFWPARPVILESQHYGLAKKSGIWGDGRLYLQATEEYHASYAGIHWWPREFLEENRALIAKINQRLGYRIQLTEAQWPGTLFSGGSFTCRTVWRNAGVAPCLPGGHPALTLKDSQGGIAEVFVDEMFNAACLQVGPLDEASERVSEAVYPVPSLLKAGVYNVFFSLGTRTGTPTLALPLVGGDGQRRYCLGSVRVSL